MNSTGGKISSNLVTYKATIADLESQGFICSAWNVKGTGDVNIVFGSALDMAWMVEMASKSAVLVY